MKKNILKILLILFWLIFFIVPQNLYAEADTSPIVKDMECPMNHKARTGWIKIYVPEWIPGLCCVWPLTWDGSDKGHRWEYFCYVEKWASSVVGMLWDIIKYFTFLAWLGWVLYLVINWIMYSMWWMDQAMKDEAKKRIVKTISWLVLLFLSWVILNIIAPWIYTYKST